MPRRLPRRSPGRQHGGRPATSVVDPERLAQVASLVELVTGTPAADVRAEHRFVDDLRIDSLSMVEVLEGCEQRLGVPVPDEVTRQLVHVGDLVDWLVHQGRRTPGA